MRYIVAALLALALAAAVRAQTITEPAAQQIQRLAPQLVPFSGSVGNFESLVSGLIAGTPVTLTTLGADGLMQIVTFVPGATMSPVDAARSLESARQNLIARGITAPNAQQLAVALTGGTLTTGTTSTAIPGVLAGTSALQLRNELIPVSTAAGEANLTANLQALRTALAQGTVAPGGPMNDFEVDQALQLAIALLAQQGIVNPTAEQLRVALAGGNLQSAEGANVPVQGVLQGRVRNTSDSPFFGTSNSRFTGTSNSRFTGTSNTSRTINPVVTPPAVTGVAGVRRPNIAIGANRAIPRPGR